MTASRKLCACLSSIAILLTMSGCHAFSALLTSQRDPTADPEAYIQEFRNNRLYNLLDKDLQQCYGTLYTALTDGFDHDDAVTLLGKETEQKSTIGLAVKLPCDVSSMNEAKTLYNAFAYDNPQFFYLSNTYGLEGYEKKGAAHYDTLVLSYTMDAATRREAQKKFDDSINKIMVDRPQTTDDFETELYLHDKLIEGCTYDIEAASAGFAEEPTAYSAYGALVEGEAVCEGYARAIQLLLKRCGIHSTLVIGESVKSGEQHMWNLVSVNGKEYHLDATWNDSEDRTRHNYFNVTTNQISISHRIAEKQLGVTNCIATDDNYYVRNGWYVDTYNRQQIAEIIAERIKRGATAVELFFAEDKFDNALLFLKNRQAAKDIINPYLTDSGISLWDYTLYGETDEHILCIRKK